MTRTCCVHQPNTRTFIFFNICLWFPLIWMKHLSEQAICMQVKTPFCYHKPRIKHQRKTFFGDWEETGKHEKTEKKRERERDCSFTQSQRLINGGVESKKRQFGNNPSRAVWPWHWEEREEVISLTKQLGVSSLIRGGGRGLKRVQYPERRRYVLLKDTSADRDVL